MRTNWGDGETAEVTRMNKQFYDELYRGTDVASLVEKIQRVDAYFDQANKTDTSWVELFHGGLRDRLAGSRVLEVGAGTGLKALAMAAFGAEVVAIDLSDETPAIIEAAASALGLADTVTAVSGDFALTAFPAASFDFVLGSGFLHHLTHQAEETTLRQTARILKRDGEARFGEPAENSKLLDELRWLVPVRGRPSRLQVSAFRAYRARDPHPLRDNSADHFRRAAATYFDEVSIVPLGGLERFHRLFPRGKSERAYRRFALRVESRLPNRVQEYIARSQTVILRKPRPQES